MIPALEIYPIRFGPLELQPFGVLVALGLFFGHELAKKRAPVYGVSRADLNGFGAWMLVCAFVLAHVLDEVFYHPDVLRQRPWSILAIWDGMSSYGGFFGAIVGAVLWSHVETSARAPFFRVRRERRSLLAVSELVASIFPVGWMFGRAGCAVVHDHLGVLSSAPLAVQFGAGPTTDYRWFALHHGELPRYDLGLLELFFTIALVVAFAATWRAKLPLGSYLAALCVVYPPVRFAMDFLRATDDDGGDARYLALTPAQWACFAFFVIGVAMAMRVRTSALTPTASAPTR
jgi:phosphatidylglycerol:prolipoprotein diacylglycerol transferase